MSAITVNGINGVFQQEECIEGDEFIGYTYSTTYTGTEATIRDLAVTFGNKGWKIKMTIRNNGTDSNYASLDVSKPDDTILPPTTWAVKSQNIEKNLIEANDLPMLSGLTSDNKVEIEKRVRNPDTAIALSAAPKNMPLADFVHKKFNIINFLMADITKIQVPVKVFKKIQVLPYRKTPAWTKQYEGKIISKNVLISAFQVDDWLIPELPDDPFTGVQQDPVTNINFMWGYFVGGIDGQSNARQRMQWEQEFTYDKWTVYQNPTDIHGIYSCIL